jgi:hypothetical protein
MLNLNIYLNYPFYLSLINFIISYNLYFNFNYTHITIYIASVFMIDFIDF